MESQTFRDELYDVTDDFLTYLRNLPDLPDWYRTPVDLLEAARLELMMQLRPPIRDWIAWRRVIELRANQVEMFVPDNLRPTLEADLRHMQLPCEVRVTGLVAAETESKHRKPSALRLAAHWLVNRAEARWLPRRRVPVGNLDKARILFLDQHANSAQVLIPVWERLSKLSHYQCLYVAGREKVRRALARHGIDAPNLRRCEPYIPAKTLRPPRWSELLQRYFSYLEDRSGVPTPMSVRRGFQRVDGYLAEVKLTAIRLDQVFRRFRPDAFFVSSGAHMPARIGELLCRRSDCVSVHLQHGIYKGDKESRNLLSDVICLWGEFHRRRMELNPCPAELLVTGSPKHDELLRKYAALPQSNRPLVAFYSTRSGSWVIGTSDFERHLAAVRTAAATLPDVDFVIKLHPGETRGVVERLNAEANLPSNLRVTHTDDAYELLQRCHAAVTVSSTIGYEALLFRRPLLILNLTGRECQLPLPTECTAAYVTQADDLASAIRRTLSAPRESVAAADDFWRNDGRAAERISAMLDSRRRSMIASSQTHSG